MTNELKSDVVPAVALQNFQVAIDAAQDSIDASNVARTCFKQKVAGLNVVMRRPTYNKDFPEDSTALLLKLKYEIENRARYAEYGAAWAEADKRMDGLRDAVDVIDACRSAARSALAANSLDVSMESALRQCIDDGFRVTDVAMWLRLELAYDTRGPNFSIPRSWLPYCRDASPFVFAKIPMGFQPRCYTLRLNALVPQGDRQYNYIEAIAPYESDMLWKMSAGGLVSGRPYLTCEEATNIWILCSLIMGKQRFSQLAPVVVNVLTGEILEEQPT